jgi:hypothetical protein
MFIGNCFYDVDVHVEHIFDLLRNENRGLELQILRQICSIFSGKYFKNNFTPISLCSPAQNRKNGFLHSLTPPTSKIEAYKLF